MQLATRPDRETLRERERKSRARRAAKLERQRATLEVLENVAPIVPTLFDDDDEVWDAVLDPKTARLRSQMRRFMQLTKQQRELERDQEQLVLLLQEHRLASLAIEGLLRFKARDEWEECVKRWRTITLRNYEPIPLEDCLAELEAAEKERDAFLWSLDTRMIGASFFGWRARRRLVPSRGAIQFSFEKTLRGFPMSGFGDVTWALYTDLAVYESLMDQRVRCWLHVLEKVTPDIWIVREAERHPAHAINIHKLYIVARVQTAKRTTHIARSLFMPKIQNKISSDSDMWATNFVWQTVDALNDDGTDHRVQIGGALAGEDMNYAARWLVGTLGMLLRVERVATNRGLLTDVAE